MIDAIKTGIIYYVLQQQASRGIEHLAMNWQHGCLCITQQPA
jgi:hypothetical protein